MRSHKEKYKILCKNCQKDFEIWFSRKDIAKYCSVQCQKIGQRQNIGPNKGRIFTQAERLNMSLAARERYRYEQVWNKGKKTGRLKAISNENHYLWKGDKAGYQSIHHWIRKQLGKPMECVYCGDRDKRLEWASISHKARRDLNDYISLCCKCHSKYDDIPSKAWATKRLRIL